MGITRWGFYHLPVGSICDSNSEQEASEKSGNEELLQTITEPAAWHMSIPTSYTFFQKTKAGD